MILERRDRASQGFQWLNDAFKAAGRANRGSARRNGAAEVVSAVVGAGLSLAGPVAMGVSYSRNKSIPWAIAHGAVGPAYLVYAAATRSKRRKNGPTMHEPHYPFARKAEQYAGFTDSALQYNLKDAVRARDAAERMRGGEVSAAWYADDVHTLLAELRRRGVRKNGGPSARRNPIPRGVHRTPGAFHTATAGWSPSRHQRAAEAHEHAARLKYRSKTPDGRPPTMSSRTANLTEYHIQMARAHGLAGGGMGLEASRAAQSAAAYYDRAKAAPKSPRENKGRRR